MLSFESDWKPPLGDALHKALSDGDAASRSDIPRGKYIGEAVDPPKDEAELFIKCEACGAWIDCRDLGMVFDHEGPLPHPDREQ